MDFVSSICYNGVTTAGSMSALCKKTGSPLGKRGLSGSLVCKMSKFPFFLCGVYPILTLWLDIV